MNGEREGQGTITMPPAEGEEPGFTYTGAWQGGEINGMGVATYANGDVYEGMFENGRRQGEGTIRFATGETASGNWVDGALDGTAAPANAETPEAPAETPAD